MTKTLNKTYLSKWAWPLITVSLNAGLAATGGVVWLSKVDPSAVNLLSFWNLWASIQIWCVLFSTGFVGMFLTVLAKSPLDFSQVIVDAPENVEVKVEVKELPPQNPPESK